MKFIVDKYGNYTSFKYNFYNLTDLYNYLKSNPEVNKKIFEEQASVVASKNFSGESLDKSIEYLRGGYNVDFDKFDLEVKKLKKLGYEDENSTRLEHCVRGGVYLSPLVATGVHKCMVRYSKDPDPKRITIYFQLAYPSYTTVDQVINRGVATINLVQSLEEAGYLVDLKVFNLSYCGDEFIDININLKTIDERLNISKCYYPLVGREFLRRLLFRVLESAPVKNCWGVGYGRGASESEIRKFYNLRERDIVIPSPDVVGIDGVDIYSDTVNLFKELNLQNEFDLSKYNQKVKKKIK